MTDELVEALARRLWEVRYPNIPLCEPSKNRHCYEAEMKLARECLRQMRYAHFMGRASEGRPSGVPEPPFTIAPEGWTP